MSALPPKADMCGATKDVRSGPKADIRRKLICRLLDYFVGARDQRWRNGDAERFRGLEIEANSTQGGDSAMVALSADKEARSKFD